MKRLSLVAAICLFSACTPVDGDGSEAAPEVGTVNANESVMAVEAGGDIGDGIQRPMLQMMSYNEFSGPIEMGMGCSFIAENNTDPIFVATAEDSAEVNGRAAIKINDHIVVLKHKGVGIAAVEEGGLFSSEAIEVMIKHANVEATSNGEATYFWNATLNISQDEGGSNGYEGKYECGA